MKQPANPPQRLLKRNIEQMQGFIASVFDFVSVKSCEHHDDSQGLHSYSSIRPFLHSSHPVLLLGSFHSLAAKQEYRGVFKKQNYTNTYLMQSLHGKSHPSSKFLFFTFASLPWLEQRRMRRLCRASVSLSNIAVATPKKFFPRDSTNLPSSKRLKRFRWRDGSSIGSVRYASSGSFIHERHEGQSLGSRCR